MLFDIYLIGGRWGKALKLDLDDNWLKSTIILKSTQLFYSWQYGGRLSFFFFYVSLKSSGLAHVYHCNYTAL